MAKLPSGWIFIPRMKDASHIELVERKLITCHECRYYNPAGCSPGFGWCERSGMDRGVTDDWYCADAEEGNNGS